MCGQLRNEMRALYLHTDGVVVIAAALDTDDHGGILYSEIPLGRRLVWHAVVFFCEAYLIYQLRLRYERSRIAR